MKKKNSLIIIFAVIVVILLIYFNQSQTLTIGASTIGSCTQPYFTSSDPFFKNGTYQCTIVASGSGKSLDITLSPNDMQRLFGVRTTETIKGRVELINEKCKYLVDASRPTRLYMFYLIRRSFTWNDYYGIDCHKPYLSPRAYTPYATSIPQLLYFTKFKCMCSSCGLDALSYHRERCLAGCDYVFRQEVGDAYYLDPSVIYEYNIKVNVSYGGKDYVTVLNSGETTKMTDAYRIELLGALLGQQSCPANPDAVVYVKNDFTKNPISLRNKVHMENVLFSQTGIVDANSGVNLAAAHKSKVDAFLNSTPSMGQYCNLSKISGNITSLASAKNALYGSYIECTPTGKVAIPVFNLFINAEKITLHIPVGKPEILNVTSKATTAGLLSYVDVKIKNGGETDVIEASLLCNRDVSPFSSKELIKENETKIISIPYQGAGLITTCNVTAYSVNAPQNRDIKEIELNIKPFCTRSPPSNKHKLVYTEYGCAYICDNYKEDTDVFHSSCAQIKTYDRCIERNESLQCIERLTYIGHHCVGEGKYTTLNQYLDAVHNGRLQPFIPKQIPHKYFIAEFNEVPICRYVDEYGYLNGVKLTELEFDYSKTPYEATVAQLPQLPQQPTENQESIKEKPADITTPAAASTEIPLIHLVAGVVIIGGAAWYFFLRRA